MHISQLAIRRPITTMMVFICCVVIGGISAQLLPLEKFPEVEFPGIFVNVPYPGSTPSEVERVITRPIEEVVGTVSGIKAMNSQSTETGAFIFLEFDWGEDVSIKGVEVREKIDGIRSQLPGDLERYFVNMFSTADEELLQFRISSNRDLDGAYDLLDRHLKRRIERLDGVGKVEIYGVNKKEIKIELEADRLTAHGIDIGRLTQDLQRSNFSVAAGRITDGSRRYMVQPLGEFKDVEDIRNLVIGPNNLRLSDVAVIKYEGPELEYGRHLDRKYAVGMNVFKASSYNTVEVARRVMDEITAIQGEPQLEGIRLITFEDQAASVLASLRELLMAGLLGALLAFFVLYFFLRQLSTTLIVSLAVPISITITLAVLHFFGLSLNILSLMGLMLAVGMLVDNAVVVTESIHQQQLKDSNVERATIKGVKSVSMAVIAGTLTTVIVFSPFIVSPKDQVSLFMKHVSIAICAALAASLIISQTVIPLLTSRLKPPKARAMFIDRFVDQYGNYLRWTLRHRGWSVLMILGILFSVIIPASLVNSEFFPDEDAGTQIDIYHNINGSYTVERVEAYVTKIEDYLYAYQDNFEFSSVYSYYTGDYAETRLYLNEGDDRTKSVDEIKDAILADLPKDAISKPAFKWASSIGGGESMRISLIGESSEQLVELSDYVVRTLEAVPGLTDVQSDAEQGREEIQIQVDRTRAPQYGFTPQNVAGAISTAMRGQNLRKLRTEDGEVDIRLAFQDADQQTLEDLKTLPLVNDQGQKVQLASLAEFSIRRGPRTIRRENRLTMLGIRANLDDITTDEARERINAIMDRIEFPAGYSWSYGQNISRADESQQILIVNLLMALVMIYIVMAALFESLISPAAIWTSIIFAIVGVFWFFLITNTTFSVMGWIGVFILIGIVVNNGIVLLDHVIQLRNSGLSRLEALVEGGKERLRPILMTAFTTILGLIPLCISTSQIGGDGPPYFPMARAIVGGLLFSTIVTLMVLPTIYVLLDDLSLWARRVVREAG